MLHNNFHEELFYCWSGTIYHIFVLLLLVSITILDYLQYWMIIRQYIRLLFHVLEYHSAIPMPFTLQYDSILSGHKRINDIYSKYDAPNLSGNTYFVSNLNDKCPMYMCIFSIFIEKYQ